MLNHTRLDLAGAELHELEQSLAELGKPGSTAGRSFSGCTSAASPTSRS